MPLSNVQQQVAQQTRYKLPRDYVFSLYNSNLFDTDLHPVTGLPTPGLHTRIADLKANARTYTPTLNRPGSAKFTVPLTSDDAYNIIDQEVVRSIIIYANDQNGVQTPMWSGMIWTCDPDPANNVLTVTCVGWLELLYHREFRQPYIFNNIDAGVIGTRLLGVIRNQSANANVVTPAGSIFPITGTVTSGSNVITALSGNSKNPFNLNDSISGTGIPANTIVTGVTATTMTISNKATVTNTLVPLTSNSVATAENLMGAAGELNDLAQITNSGGFDTGYPAVTTYWDVNADLIPSGQNAIQLVATATGNGYALVGPTGTSFRAPCDSSGVYEFRFLADALTLTGAATYGVTINWHDYGDNLVSQTALTSTALGVREFRQTAACPATACYMRVYLTVTSPSGTQANVIFSALRVSKTAVNVVPFPIHLGTVTSPANPSGANRTRSYQIGAKIGQALEELSTIESGFDYEVALSKETITGGSTFVRRLNINWSLVKTGTTIRGIGQDRPDLVLGFNWGPENLSNVSQPSDASQLANRMNGRAPGGYAMAQDMTSISKYGIFEDSASISDANASATVLSGYAGAEVAFRKIPPKIITPTLMPYDGNPDKKYPRFKIDFDIGDIGYAVVDKGALQVGRTGNRQAVRFFSASVDIDDEGNETISAIQTTASA